MAVYVLGIIEGIVEIEVGLFWVEVECDESVCWIKGWVEVLVFVNDSV